MVPHGKYCILFHRMKSGKIHWNIRRCSSQILEGHSICPLHLHFCRTMPPLWWQHQCLVRVLATCFHLNTIFKSRAGANMIKSIPILVMLCALSEWWFSNGSIFINIHELLALILLLKRLLSEIPTTRKRLLYRLWNCIKVITCGTCTKAYVYWWFQIHLFSTYHGKYFHRPNLINVYQYCSM